jgi:hypothetical protein
MLTVPVDWQTFFADRETDVSVNAKMKGLETLFSETVSKSDCIKLLKEENDAVFLTINPINKRASIAHHFNQFGGTRTQPNSLFSAMIGFDHQAFAVMIDIDSLLQGVKIRVPTWDTLKECKSIASFKALVAPAEPVAGAEGIDEEKNEEGATFEEVYFRNFVLPPPFLANVLVDSDSRDPCALIIEAMNAISAFDERHKEDQDMPLATDALVHIVQFLWAAGKELVTGSPLLTAEEPNYIKWSATIHKECLAETPAARLQHQNQQGQVSDATMQSIATSISVQGQTLEKIHELRKDTSAESKKSYTTILHPVRVRLLLNASSTDGKTVPIDPSLEAQSFYKCKTVGAAKIHLEHSLVHVHKCIISLSIGFVTNLYNGAFVWDSPNKPNNWCGFQFAKPPPDSSSGVQEALILSLKATEGKGWSENDILKALVQGLVIAKSVSELQHNLHNEHSAACFFFGDNSIIAVNLAKCLTHVQNHFQVYEELQVKDKMFVAQVIYSCSVRIQNWFQQCLQQEIRSNVDDSLIDFTTDHRDIVNRRFAISLPASISAFKRPSVPQNGSNSDNEANSPPRESDKKRKSKKQGNREGGRATVGDTNTKTVCNWLLKDNESYKKIFAGKNKPKFPAGNCRWCPRFHTKGFCFEDCPDKNNHIPSMDIPKEQREDYSFHVSECRGN